MKKAKDLFLNFLWKITKKQIPIKIDAKFLITDPKQVMDSLNEYFESKTNKLN